MKNSITKFGTTCVGNNCARVPILDRFSTDMKFKWVLVMKNIRKELVQNHSRSEKECLTSHTVSTAESYLEYRFSPGMRRIPTVRQSTFMESDSFVDSVHSHYTPEHVLSFFYKANFHRVQENIYVCDMLPM